MTQSKFFGTPDRRNWLIALLMLAGIGKISLFLLGTTYNPEYIFRPDSFSYIHSAQALVHTGRFALSQEQPEIPQLIRTPGYPLFLATVFALCGERYTLVILCQILFSVSTLLLTYLLAKHLWQSLSTAILAVALLTLDMPSLISSQVILTETLFTCLLILSVLMLTCLIDASVRWWLVLSFGYGLAAALTTLTRPITYYLLPLLLVFAGLHLRFRSAASWQRMLLFLLVSMAPYIILIGGWQWRNDRLTGSPEFSYIQGANLLFYRGAGIVAQRERISLGTAQQQLGYDDFLKVCTQPTRIAAAHQEWKRQSLALFTQHPWLLCKDLLTGCVKMLAMPGEDSLLAYLGLARESSGPLGDIVSLSWSDYLTKWGQQNFGRFVLWGLGECYLIGVYLGIGLFVNQSCHTHTLFRIRNLILWSTIAYFIAVSANAGAYYRFRVPFMPILCVYAAHGWIGAASAIFTRRSSLSVCLAKEPGRCR